MNLRSKLLSGTIFLTLIFGGIFWLLPKVYAETQLQSILKEVVSKIEEISNLKNNEALSRPDKEKKELAARKQALEKIFDLTLLEDNDLKNKLLALKELDEKQKNIQQALLDFLAENGSAYKELKNRLEKIETSEDAKQLAIDFKNWRHNVYNPKVEKILSFALVFQQQKILGIAKDRFKKIKSDLLRLEDARVIKKEDTAGLIKKASDNLEKAEKLNSQAEILVTKILYEEFFPATPTLNQTDIDNPEAIKLYATENPNEQTGPTVKKFIEDSLREIKTAYRLFLDIGKIVR